MVILFQNIVDSCRMFRVVNYEMLTLYIVRQSNITVALGRNADFVVSKKAWVEIDVRFIFFKRVAK